MTAALYLRKSRAEEREPVEETLARHREILTSYAGTHGITVPVIYEEVASGDRLSGRPEMLRLLEDLPRYDAVLCMDIDRLGRGAMTEQGYIFDRIREAGLAIVTPAKTYDLRDDLDDSLLSFKALFAREEYKMIRARLRRGTQKALDEGCYLSNAPYGYRRVRIGKKPTLEIHEHEAKAVRTAFAMYLSGKGCQSIADSLHTMGYHPRRGERFSRSTVGKMLQNPVYIGKVIWNQYDKSQGKRLRPEGERRVIDGLHPPVIEEEIFMQVAALLRQHGHLPYRKPEKLENPLAGIVFCSVCGRTMLRQPGTVPALACSTTGCCVSSRLDTVERILVTGLEACLPGFFDGYWKNSPLTRNRMLKSVVRRAVYTKQKGSPYGSAPEIRVMEWRNP